MSREIFERGHAVSVLLYDPVRDEVGLIEQFRPGAMAAGWQPWLIEVVAGIIDKDAAPRDVAIREAEEEAGVAISELLPVCKYLVTPGGSTETMEIFCARVDSSTLGGIHGLEDEGEDIRVFSVAADEAIGWIESGKVGNSCAIIALQWLALNRQKLIARWTA
jgi:ADP-ribose pyrophosphatase